MLQIGNIDIASPVFLAPMSGVTDAPFRSQVLAFGGPAVVTEMVAGEEYAADHAMFRLRAASHTGAAPHIVQLVGRDPHWMKTAAQLISAEGADVIDINMGCPSRRVTGGQSGCALMREPDLARRLIAETIAGSSVPVTVKMRLGWDDDHLNATEIAQIAEQEGAQLITVHARTRAQLYKGKADWSRVASIAHGVSVPTIVNGDIISTDTAKRALRASHAAGVMVGRGALGRPWLIAQIAAELRGMEFAQPSLRQKLAGLTKQFSQASNLYGLTLGIRTFRKHLAASLDALVEDEGLKISRERKVRLCTSVDATWIERELEALEQMDLEAA